MTQKPLLVDIETALTVKCPRCLAPAKHPCYTMPLNDTHRDRRKAALEEQAFQAKAAKVRAAQQEGCVCRNHMGHPKVLHKTKAMAISWVMKQAPRRGLKGMAMEFYECPRKRGWHVRTKRS